MSRLIEWSEYVKSQGMGVLFLEPDARAWEVGPKYDNPPLGLYLRGQGMCLIQKGLWGKAKGFEVLIHEFGHHLCHCGKLTYKDNPFVRKYFRKVSRPWLLSYDPWDREEELIVQCLALWALDWGDNYEVNKGFKDFLIDLGAAPPPF